MALKLIRSDHFKNEILYIANKIKKPFLGRNGF
jgi:hypothetical protein